MPRNGGWEFPSPEGSLLHALLVSLDHLLDHLAADGAGFAGGQVAIVALLKIYTDFLGSLHFELLHSLLCLRNVDLVITIAHFETLLCFLRKT